MDYLFRPHWRHKECGGVVTGVDELFRCLKCQQAGSAIGAAIPDQYGSSKEYFCCHPELEVTLLNGHTASAHEGVMPS